MTTVHARSETATAALTYIRALLADGGHTVHAPAYWEDRGIRIANIPGGNTVAHCTTCYQAARRGGFTESDAQRQTWHAEGFAHYVEQAANEHYDNTHSMEASR